MNFVFYFIFLFFLGIILGQVFDLLISKFQKIMIPSNDSQEGIEKKEKLVSIYLTIFTLLTGLKGIQNQDKLTLLTYGLFLVSIIFYYMDLGVNKYKVVTPFCGITAAFAFSYILVFFTLSSIPILLKILYGFFIWILIAWSLTQSYENKNVEGEYNLH